MVKVFYNLSGRFNDDKSGLLFEQRCAGEDDGSLKASAVEHAAHGQRARPTEEEASRNRAMNEDCVASSRPDTAFRVKVRGFELCSSQALLGFAQFNPRQLSRLVFVAFATHSQMR